MKVSRWFSFCIQAINVSQNTTVLNYQPQSEALANDQTLQNTNVADYQIAVTADWWLLAY